MGIFYDNDPEKGGKEISFWEHLERSGFVQNVKEKGFPIFPTHNSELRKEHKQEAFEKALNAFIDDRTIKKLQITEEDRKAFRVMWLNNEIQITEKLIAANNSNSDRIELSKYLNFVQTEREALINQKEIQLIETKTPSIQDGEASFSNGLTLKQQALFLIYKGVKLSPINAEKYLPKGLSSTDKLLQHFRELSDKRALTGNCISKKAYKPLKNDFERVIQELEGEAKQAAERDFRLFLQNNDNW
jgi:hypothetical protein